MITIPTIAQLYTSVKTNLETEYGGSFPLFGKIFLNALSAVQAAKLKLYYLAIGSLQRNIFVDLADSESKGGTLERFGRIKLNRNPFPARSGQYTVSVTGLVGAVIPVSTTFKSNDDSANAGKLFIVDRPLVFAGTTQAITIRALEAGLTSRLEVGDELTLTAPIANVDRTAEVTAETLEPLAPESLEEYRRKTLESFRTEPQGGAGSDYRLWASEVQGVKQTFPYAKTNAPGEVNLYVEADLGNSTDGKGTPSNALLDDVEAAIELDPDTSKPLDERGRRPLQVIVNYLPVTIKNIKIEITGFVGITGPIQTLIFNALKSEIDNIRPFVASVDILANKNDILDINQIISTVLAVRPGSVFGVVVLKVDNVSVNTKTFIDGDIPYLDTVTYL